MQYQTIPHANHITINDRQFSLSNNSIYPTLSGYTLNGIRYNLFSQLIISEINDFCTKKMWRYSLKENGQEITFRYDFVKIPVMDDINSFSSLSVTQQNLAHLVCPHTTAFHSSTALWGDYYKCATQNRFSYHSKPQISFPWPLQLVCSGRAGMSFRPCKASRVQVPQPHPPSGSSRGCSIQSSLWLLESSSTGERIALPARCSVGKQDCQQMKI